MWGIIGIALISIVGVIIAFYILLYSLSGGMRRTAQDFLETLIKKDYEKAYQYLSAHIKHDVWLENFQEYLFTRYMDDFSDYRRSEFNIATNGSNGTFKTDLILKNESIIPLGLELMKFNGKWKIHAIDIQIRVADRALKNNVIKLSSIRTNKEI